MSSASPKTSASSSETSNPLDQPQRPTMPPINRSAGRNVHIYDPNDPDTVLGGLVLTPGVTNANFYSMVEIIVIFSGTFFLYDGGETKIERDDYPLQPGNHASGTRVAAFTEAVRNRDRRCVISGAIVHIFDGITIQSAKGGSINSVQNGLLLDCTVHQLFDAYDISINPDDNYKVVVFRPNLRVAVLANMKGAREPVFKHDFPPGSDIVSDILQGPKAVERMGFELFSRLSAQIQLFPNGR
ncbi:hypothetical protein K469DRAFT_705164 [Zopfia rhizophila CBS 207.26]|uniref:Uncharacterized protein n=1 Tax=Zopfia rhizophila CBS 207.26 TaxID=1314779 RepID=A0A6A6EA92_9PEZI|nr:hypothetical protein K469DRAFT_705164 [Zopfia rhizophila CBS 207.26]